MKHRTFGERVLFNISRFVSFYLVVALVTSSTVLLFCEGMELQEELVRQNGPMTFLWTLGMAVIACGLDALRRHIAVERPLKRIVDALERMGRGELDRRLDVRDFSEIGFREICCGIDRLARELESVETLKTDFISNVSHELKTPLAVMKNYAVLLQDETLPPEQRREYAEAIEGTAARMAALVSNILKLNKLENQQIFPQVRCFDLGEQLAECLLQFETAWEERELECSLAEDIQVEADPEQEEIRRIREKYQPRETSKLERLRELDRSVTRKGTAAALTLGVLGLLILGTGMSLCLVWAMYLPGIPMGLVGMALAGMAYPVCQRINRRERERLAPEILRLTEELLQ